MSLAAQAVLVDPIPWMFYGAVLASLAWIAVVVIVAFVYRNKGQNDILEGKKLDKFKKVGKPRGKTTTWLSYRLVQDENGIKPGGFIKQPPKKGSR